MKLKRLRGALFGVLAAALASGCGAPPAPPADEYAGGWEAAAEAEIGAEEYAAADDGYVPPNVLWILLDALRSHNLSAYGYDRETTPNLEALAARGTLMANNFAQGLWTAISVPSYMTGKYFPVLVHEPAQAMEMLREVPPGERLLPEIMRENGYTATMITAHSWFTPRSRLWNAFDEAIYIPPRDKDRVYYAEFEHVNEVVFNWLDKRRDERPFFLYVHTLDTHFPHVVDPPFDKWVDPDYETRQVTEKGEPAARYGSRFTREDQEYLRGLYDGSLLYADYHLGKMLEWMETLGLLDNTIVVVSSDHGDMLGEDGTRWGHIAFSSDWIMKTPLIMAGPGIPEGRRITDLTENADIVPTLVDLLGLQGDIRTDGQSLMPIAWNEPGARPRPYAFSKFVSGGYDGVTTVILRGKDHKYEVALDGDRLEAFWQAPDTTAVRVDMTARAPEALAAAREHVRTVIEPKWEAYNDLQSSAIYLTLYRSIETNASPADAVVIHNQGENPGTVRDGKWAYNNTWKVLWTRGWMEDVPPLTLTYPVPDGLYLLQAEVWSDENYMGYPATAMEIRVNEETGFRRVARDRTPSEEKGYYYIDIGNYEIKDGKLEVTIKNGGPTHWTMLRAFRLLRVTEVQTVTEEDQERLDQLRALGYLD